MKAILVNEDKSLRWDNVPDPIIKSDEVLVKIEAAADTESMMGYDYGENLDTALGGSWVAKTYLVHFAPENSLAKGSNATAL